MPDSLPRGVLVLSSLLIIPASLLDQLHWAFPFQHLQVGGYFISAYFLFDIVLCFYCHFIYYENKYSSRKTIKHIAWGFINAKSYALLILLFASNMAIPVPMVTWLIDAYLGVTGKLARMFTDNFFHWQELHYTFHRMGHLPTVYEQAHKFHHVLHGSSAFDAHSIFGNGMPEEFFFLLFEMACMHLLSLPPVHMNFFLLKMIIQNKFAHTEVPGDTAGDNFHTGHHRLHNKNFGHSCLLDMLFLTCESNNTYRMTINKSVYQVVKSKEENQISFSFARLPIMQSDPE